MHHYKQASTISPFKRLQCQMRLLFKESTRAILLATRWFLSLGSFSLRNSKITFSLRSLTLSARKDQDQEPWRGIFQGVKMKVRASKEGELTVSPVNWINPFGPPGPGFCDGQKQINSKPILTPAVVLFLLFFCCLNHLLTLLPSSGEGRRKKRLGSSARAFKCRPGPRLCVARCQMTWWFPCKVLAGAALSRPRGWRIAELRGCAALTLPSACTSRLLFNNGRNSCFQMWTCPALTRMTSSPVCATQNNIFIS